jgi:ADP-ribose pyrophosphatase
MGASADLSPWRRLQRQRVYENPWMAVDEDLVELPTGAKTMYGVVRCGECVGMLPFVDDSHVMLVQQWRYIAGRTTWEMPTGGVHDGETVEEAAQRELAEEAGVEAGVLTPLTSYATSKSVVDETAHLFVARDLAPASRPPDDTELIRLQTFRFDEALSMVLSGEIVDSMTIVAMLWADRMART